MCAAEERESDSRGSTDFIVAQSNRSQERFGLCASVIATDAGSRLALRASGRPHRCSEADLACARRCLSPERRKASRWIRPKTFGSIPKRPSPTPTRGAVPRGYRRPAIHRPYQLTRPHPRRSQCPPSPLRPPRRSTVFEPQPPSVSNDAKRVPCGCGGRVNSRTRRSQA